MNELYMYNLIIISDDIKNVTIEMFACSLRDYLTSPDLLKIKRLAAGNSNIDDMRILSINRLGRMTSDVFRDGTTCLVLYLDNAS